MDEYNLLRGELALLIEIACPLDVMMVPVELLVTAVADEVEVVDVM